MTTEAPMATPLDEVHRRLGASFTDFAGWTMPVRYDSDVAEHQAVRQQAGLFDLSHMGEIELRGPEAGRALDHALVGKASAIGVGRARYTMLCTEDGGVLDDLVVYRLAEEHYLVVANAGNVAAVVPALKERVAGYDAELTDASRDWALIAVQGPATLAVLEGLVDVALDELKYYAISEARVAGEPVLLARTGYTGEDGFEIYCRPDVAPALWEAILTAGEPHGLRPCGLACRDSLRLEAGMPLHGHELGVDISPFEAGLGRVVKFDKDEPFVGQESLAAMAETGPKRQLVGLVATGRRSPRNGYPILDTEGTPIGEITSGAPSPTLGKPIAMGFVPPAHAEPGTRLLVDIRGRHEEVEVTSLPFYSRPR